MSQSIFYSCASPYPLCPTMRGWRRMTGVAVYPPLSVHAPGPTPTILPQTGAPPRIGGVSGSPELSRPALDHIQGRRVRPCLRVHAEALVGLPCAPLGGRVRGECIAWRRVPWTPLTPPPIANFNVNCNFNARRSALLFGLLAWLSWPVVLNLASPYQVCGCLCVPPTHPHTHPHTCHACVLCCACACM
jgi:hypothetical protein